MDEPTGGATQKKRDEGKPPSVDEGTAVEKKDALAQERTSDGHDIVVTNKGVGKCSPPPCPVIHIEYAEELKDRPKLGAAYAEIERLRRLGTKASARQAAKSSKELVNALEGIRAQNKLRPKAKMLPAATNTPPATGGGLPGFRTEPTLDNAGWGPRPEGGAKGEKYAWQITSSRESLYVGGLKEESGGTGIVELDGYRAPDRMLLDAKDATPGGMYDVRGGDKFTQNVKIPKILEEAMRQGHAQKKSGAAGIEWSIADQGVQKALETFFAARGIKNKVVWKAKKGK